MAWPFVFFYPPPDDFDSLVIAVSLRADCYRYIRIAENATLAHLADAVLIAFARRCEHRHTFFMDNCVGSALGRYDQFVHGGSPYNDAQRRYTCDFWLCDVVRLGAPFKLTFGHDEACTFTCRALYTERGVPLSGENVGDAHAIVPLAEGLFPSYPLGDGLYMQVVRSRGQG